MISFHAEAQQKIYFNPEAAGAANQSKFIDIVDFIPLESASTSIDQYANLIITSQYFIIDEYSLKRVSFFTRDGKFVKTIDFKKYGSPSIIYDKGREQLNFNIQNKNYLLTSKDLVDIRANYTLKKNRKYFRNYIIDLKDSALNIRKAPLDPYQIIGARKYEDDIYYITDPPIKKSNLDSIDYELQLLKNYIPLKSYFSYNRFTDNRFKYLSTNSLPKMLVFDTDTAGLKYLSRHYQSAIYRMENDSIQLAYEFVLPLANSLPSSFFNKGFKSITERESYEAGNGERFNMIYKFVNLSEYFFISVSLFRRNETYLYAKLEDKFYKTSRIKADSSQYNLDLLKNGLGVAEKKFYYKIVVGAELTSFYETNKEKNISYPAVLERYFKLAKKNTNPVIVVYKIKE